MNHVIGTGQEKLNSVRSLQDRCQCAHLLLKSPKVLVIQIKVAEYIFRICKDSTFICVHSE